MKRRSFGISGNMACSLVESHGRMGWIGTTYLKMHERVHFIDGFLDVGPMTLDDNFIRLLRRCFAPITGRIRLWRHVVRRRGVLGRRGRIVGEKDAHMVIPNQTLNVLAILPDQQAMVLWVDKDGLRHGIRLG